MAKAETKRPVTLVQIEGITRVAEKFKKDHFKDEKLETGAHDFEVTVKFEGKLVKGLPTEVAARFTFSDYLQAVLFAYAKSLGAKRGGEWLNALLAQDGILGSVQELGAKTIVDRASPEFKALWDMHEQNAKAWVQANLPKTPREGNTTVAGTMTVV